MKSLILTAVTSVLLLGSMSALADKVVISGDPIVVREEGGVYVPASTVSTTTDGPYYFTVGDTRRVCYKEVQPNLAKVDLGIMALRLGPDSTVNVHCYTYSPDYFVVQ